MGKLTVVQSKTIEEYWSDLPSLKRQLHFREWELTENKRNDENIGGGRSSNIGDTTAQKAIILAEDKKYQSLKEKISAVESILTTLDDEMLKFVNIRYFSDDAAYIGWKDVADKLGIEKSKAFKLRNKLIDMTAKKLGWL